jgi:hypothetical protein
MQTLPPALNPPSATSHWVVLPAYARGGEQRPGRFEDRNPNFLDIDPDLARPEGFVFRRVSGAGFTPGTNSCCTTPSQGLGIDPGK